MDKEDVYRSTITMDWIANYLENTLPDPMEYHKLLCMTHSDKPTASRRYQDFLYKLAASKVTWDWQDDHTKQTILNGFADAISSLKSK